MNKYRLITITLCALLLTSFCLSKASVSASKLSPQTMINTIGSTTNLSMFQSSFLDQTFAGHRLVFLGENAHGVGEYDSLKVSLIQYLHERLGYNVIAFESPMPEASAAFYQAESLTPTDFLHQAIFRVWDTQETLPLFQYIQEQKNTQHPLTLVGFDMQPEKNELGSFLQKWLEPVDPTEAMAASQLENTFEKRFYDQTHYDFGSDQIPLEHGYSHLLNVLSTHQAELTKTPDQKQLWQVLTHSIQDRINTISYNHTENVTNSASFQEITQYRDKAMAQNLTWLSNDLFPNQKIIVWAHNGHVEKRPSEINPGTTNMFASLPTTLQNQSYVIGMFMYVGQAADNTRKVYTISQHPANSLENRLNQTNTPISFFDILHQPMNASDKWYNHPQIAYDWGQVSLAETFIPSHEFDGLLLVKHVNPPHYLP